MAKSTGGAGRATGVNAQQLVTDLGDAATRFANGNYTRTDQARLQSAGLVEASGMAMRLTEKGKSVVAATKATTPARRTGVETWKKAESPGGAPITRYEKSIANGRWTTITKMRGTPGYQISTGGGAGTGFSQSFSGEAGSLDGALRKGETFLITGTLPRIAPAWETIQSLPEK